MYDLTKKGIQWNWTEACQKAFEDLKKAFTSSPVLIMPDMTKPFRIEADASNFATGAVLSQLGDDGHRHPCAFLSQLFTKAEWNYEIYDKELLAIIRALEEWRHYLEGAPYPVEVWTDHKNLGYFQEAHKLNRRQARWSLYLTRFNLELSHKSGTTMTIPDTLSRRPDHDLGGGGDNQERILLPEKMFVREVIGEEVDRDLISEIIKADKNQFFVSLEGTLHSPIVKGKLDEFQIDEQGLVRRHGRIYVPEGGDLRRRVVRERHNSKAAGHPGRYKTLELVSRDFWWPNMGNFIHDYVTGCAVCQSTKNNTHPSKAPVVPIVAKEVAQPFEIVSMDFITGLPKSKGFDSIFVVVDQGSTKGVVFMPCNSTITAEGTADLYQEHVWKRFGLPRKQISDCGPQFAAQFMKELCKKLGIERALSTVFHPQTDGETERVNQELKQYLRAFCNFRQDNWAKHLASAEFAHNI